jgi:hypothetical protein
MTGRACSAKFATGARTGKMTAAIGATTGKMTAATAATTGKTGVAGPGCSGNCELDDQGGCEELGGTGRSAGYSDAQRRVI